MLSGAVKNATENFMAFDPFQDYKTAGYLQNRFKMPLGSDLKRLEHTSYMVALPQALAYLKKQSTLHYDDLLCVHFQMSFFRCFNEQLSVLFDIFHRCFILYYVTQTIVSDFSFVFFDNGDIVQLFCNPFVLLYCFVFLNTPLQKIRVTSILQHDL